jgi:hypothetical protein
LRKIVSPILVFICLLNFGGVYLLKEWNRSCIRKTIREEILSGALTNAVTVLEIESPGTNPFFHRLDQYEFIYRDQLYDIISERTSESRVTFVCVHDTKEEGLIRAYAKRPVGKTARTFTHLLIHQALIPSFLIRPLEIPHLIQYSEYTFPLISWQQSPPAPPPEIG